MWINNKFQATKAKTIMASSPAKREPSPPQLSHPISSDPKPTWDSWVRTYDWRFKQWWGQKLVPGMKSSFCFLWNQCKKKNKKIKILLLIEKLRRQGKFSAGGEKDRIFPSNIIFCYFRSTSGSFQGIFRYFVFMRNEGKFLFPPPGGIKEEQKCWGRVVDNGWN